MRRLATFDATTGKRRAGSIDDFAVLLRAMPHGSAHGAGRKLTPWTVEELRRFSHRRWALNRIWPHQ